MAVNQDEILKIITGGRTSNRSEAKAEGERDLICNAEDYQAHMDYVLINPVKHGLVSRVGDRPYSTFHRLVSLGVYPHDWPGGDEGELAYSD